MVDRNTFLSDKTRVFKGRQRSEQARLEKFKGSGTTGAFGGDEQSVQMVREKAGRSIRRTQVALGRETPVVRAVKV